MRIAHISDLHLCGKYKKNNIERTEILIRHALDNGVQHFVITGDISDNADENDFFVFKEILRKYDLLNSDKTTIIIGNHDIFGGPQTAQDVFNFPSKCMLVNYHEKVSIFINYFKELFVNAIFPDEEMFFPFLKEFKDTLFIGLNSIDHYSRFKNPFASNGKVSLPQIRALKHLLSAGDFKEKIKIVLIHHHFYKKDMIARSSQSSIWNKIEYFTMKLRGKKDLIKIFEKYNVKLILHGHSHDMVDYYRKGIRCINAGGSIENDSSDELSLYIIDAFPFDLSVTLSPVLLNQIDDVHKPELVNSVAI
jgi:3',5'-cyclic AMP phosphodiesterase CpdA